MYVLERVGEVKVCVAAKLTCHKVSFVSLSSEHHRASSRYLGCMNVSVYALSCGPV